jgi:hypothetical protein
MALKLSQLIKSCCTETNSATETESIGLPANAQLSSFLQLLYQNLPGQDNFDSSTGTGKKLTSPIRSATNPTAWPLWLIG